MQWFYAKDGQQVGPVTTEDLISKRKSGEINPATLVWKEGLPEWVAFETLPELNASASTAAPSAATTATTGSAAPRNSTMAQPAPGRAPENPIPTYLWQSIAATVLCCLPAGVVGIIFASQVQSHLSRGDYAAAENASRKAKLWTTVSFVIGLVVGILYFGASIYVGFNSATPTPVTPAP